MSSYTQINLAARPTPGPITRDLFEIVTKEVPSAGAGQLVVKQTHMSLDPAMIGWMSPDTESYVPPVGIGEVMRSSGIGQVVESQHPDFAVGDRVRGMMGWTEYCLSDGECATHQFGSNLGPPVSASEFAEITGSRYTETRRANRQ